MTAVDIRPLEEAVTPSASAGKSTAWWGMVVLIMTEATIFAGLIGSYFFLRATSKQWPPAGIEEPEILVQPLIFSFVLWGSSLPLFWAEFGIKKGNQFRLRAGLMVSFLMGAAFMYHTFDDFEKLHFGWRDNAYGSAFYTIVGLHALHVIIGLLMNLVVQLKVWAGKITKDRHQTVDIYALYWHFVDVVWVFVFPSLFISPHLR
jgi:heme/copper-type cytochrome/quinol oxidase subunit 3